MVHMTPLLDAATLADFIVDHAKRGEVHAIYTLIKARDQIWSDRKMRAEIAAAATQNERLREALEAVDGEVVLTGHLKEIVDEALGDEQTLDDVKDMATWPEEIRKAHGINPKADHAAAVGEIGRLRTALGECAKACYLDELTLEFEPTSEAKIAMAALGIERGAVEQNAHPSPQDDFSTENDPFEEMPRTANEDGC